MRQRWQVAGLSGGHNLRADFLATSAQCMSCGEKYHLERLQDGSVGKCPGLNGLGAAARAEVAVEDYRRRVFERLHVMLTEIDRNWHLDPELRGAFELMSVAAGRGTSAVLDQDTAKGRQIMSPRYFDVASAYVQQFRAEEATK